MNCSDTMSMQGYILKCCFWRCSNALDPLLIARICYALSYFHFVVISTSTYCHGQWRTEGLLLFCA